MEKNIKRMCVYIHTHTHTHTHIYMSVCLEESMASHSNILAWRIPWTEEPGELQFLGSHRVRHD